MVKRSLKICIGVTAILLITILAVLVVLFLTVVKPKDAQITAHPVSLEDFKLVFFPTFMLNVSLGILVTVDNRNYGGFKFHESMAYVSYHGNVIAEAPIEDDTIPARRKHNISTAVTILADKLVTNPNFRGEFATGILNFTSETALHGKVSLLKLFKMKATSYSTCNITVFILAQGVDSVCKSRVKI